MELSARNLRRLCRGSPWRWQSLRFTLDRPGAGTVLAWVRRPGSLRVEDSAGRVLQLTAQFRQNYLTGNRTPWLLPASLVQPVYDDAGLVTRRPEAAYGDPGFGPTEEESARFAAWLDPVELAGDAPTALEHQLDQVVHFEAIRTTTHEGRPVWQAIAIPRHRYQRGKGPILADSANLIRIDVGTSVCVASRKISAEEAGQVAVGNDIEGLWEHSIRILALNEYMLDDVFLSDASPLTDVSEHIAWKVR